MISKPKLLNSIDFANSACVPTTICTDPSFSPDFIVAACFGLVILDKVSTVIGNPLNRSSNRCPCWRASNVVGVTVPPDSLPLSLQRPPARPPLSCRNRHHRKSGDLLPAQMTNRSAHQIWHPADHLFQDDQIAHRIQQKHLPVHEGFSRRDFTFSRNLNKLICHFTDAALNSGFSGLPAAPPNLSRLASLPS